MINYIMLTWNRKSFLIDLFNDFYKKLSIEDFKFYIIDNGSTDGTQDYLKSITEKDSRIHVIYNNDNKGLEEYKKLLKIASSNTIAEYIVIVDDDVIEFPVNFDSKLIKAMETFPKVGFLALDVVQDEKTNGAKPTIDNYTDIESNGFVLQKGPAGGWCAVMRMKDFKKIKFLINFRKFDMSSGEDSNLVWFLKNILRKGPAILKDEKCLHASGPYYSKQYGFLDRDIEKYEKSGLVDLANLYKSYR